MNKKIILLSIFVVLMFTTMSMVSAINSTSVNMQEKESPLFKYRVKQYFPKEKLREITINFFSRFLGENKIFFIQERLENNLVPYTSANTFYTFTKTAYLCTCAPRGCGP